VSTTRRIGLLTMLGPMLGLVTSCAALSSWEFAGPGDGDDAGGGGRDAREDSPTPGVDGGVDAAPIDGATPGTGPITVVQVQEFAPLDTDPDQNHARVTMKAAQLEGDLMVLAVGWYDSTVLIQSVTDLSGNVYRLAAARAVELGTGEPVSQAIYYASGIRAAVANSNTITVQFDALADGPDLRVIEVAGLDRLNPFDGGVTVRTGNSPVSTTGPLTTTSPRAFLVGAATGEEVYVVDAGASGFTFFPSSDVNLLYYRVVDAVGTHDVSSTMLASDEWVAQLAAFY